MRNTCFPSETLGLCYVLSRRRLHEQPPTKTLSTESLIIFDRQQFTCVVTLVSGGIKCILCEFTGRDPQRPALDIPLDSAHVPFPFTDGAP